MPPPAESERRYRRGRRRAGDGGSGSGTGSGNRESHDDGHNDGHDQGHEEGSLNNSRIHRRPSRGRRQVGVQATPTRRSLGHAPSPHFRDARPDMPPDASERRGVCNRNTLLGFLAATMVVAFGVWFGWRWWFAWEWPGDPRVNLPVSRLGPENIDIRASPSPLTDDFITISEAALEASLHLFLPGRTSNITFALDAPGLPRVDVASWLPAAKAKHAPLVAILANTTLTLELMEKLWPVLIHAANDLLVSGLPPAHPDYHKLNESLAKPPEPKLISLVRASRLWKEVYAMGLAWPTDARNFLGRFALRIRSEAEKRTQKTKGREDGSNGARAPKIGSPKPPNPRELLEHARRHRIPGYTLPRYLESLQPSSDTSIQLDEMLVALTTWPTKFLILMGFDNMDRDGPRKDWGLWAGHGGLCPIGERLRETSEGRCSNQRRDFKPTCTVPLKSLGGPECCGQDCITSLGDALCDAKEFLSSVAAAAERVRAAVVEEHGAMSLFERLRNRYFYEDDVTARTRTLDRALAAFYPLYSALEMQRRLLAGVAARLQRVCLLQDALQDRVRSAMSDQSRWRDLEWDDSRRMVVVLTYVTLPEIQDTFALLSNASYRIGAQDPAVWEGPLREAVKRLKTEASAGWIERLGLGDVQGKRRRARAKPT
ncbi:hypothetical protein B0I37DRAFT_174734 [Chaetomium sp. MPI-CAGE-AT-0009]|nr:hypothetical protein B0I37DRAFT_174734 [Chaetomium sp. MPI-CAGE-AT-0009]